MNKVRVCKIFTFDSAHQLVGHKAKCANVHGHTYKMEVQVEGPTIGQENTSDEGFVIDFSDLKLVVNELLIDRLDHAFIAKGDEPILPTLVSTNSKVAILGFRSTCENMAMYATWILKKAGIPVYSVKVWETPTGWAEVLASEIPESGPTYKMYGGCDHGE